MDMPNDKKLAFIHQMAKLGLKHFDTGGGVISGGPSSGNISGYVPQMGGPAGYVEGTVTNPLGTVGSSVQGLGADLTAQNTFQAGAPTGAGVVGAQQAGLASQLQNEAAGNGPNPAQQQLLQNSQMLAQQQATANAQNRAINPGLAARMSGNQAVQAGQTAASNAGIQQAEQQLAAQQQLEGLTGQEQQGALYAQGINAQTSQNNANAVNSTTGGILGGIGSALGDLFAGGGEVDQYNAPNLPDLNNSEALKKDSGSSGGGISSLAGLAAMAAHGGQIQRRTASMGTSPQYPSAMFAQGGPADGPQSFVGQFLAGMASGGLMKSGGPVKAGQPDQKATVKDDSLKNDKVPAMLSQGEIVIPRHITQHPQAAEKAAQFVAAVLAKKRMGKK